MIALPTLSWRAAALGTTPTAYRRTFAAGAGADAVLAEDGSRLGHEE